MIMTHKTKDILTQMGMTFCSRDSLLKRSLYHFANPNGDTLMLPINVKFLKYYP